MRVDTALLCDAVTVREGLLHVLGGGITRIHRPMYPAPLAASMAVRILIHPTEAAAPHELGVLLVDEDGGQLGEVTLKFQASAEGSDLQPGEELALPIPLALQGLPLPKKGMYRFELLIDGIHQLSVPFIADTNVQPPPQQPPSRKK